MANPRQEDKSTQGMEDAARRAGESAAEQTTRIGQAAADQTARVGQAAAEAGGKWLEQVRTCSSKTSRRCRTHGASAWKRRPRPWDGLPSNLVARSAFQEQEYNRQRRQRNGRRAMRKRYFTLVPLLPK